MSFYKEVPGRKTTLESTLKFDTAPTAGSTNPVTSDGVATAITEGIENATRVEEARLAAIEAVIPSDASKNNKLTAQSDLDSKLSLYDAMIYRTNAAGGGWYKVAERKGLPNNDNVAGVFEGYITNNETTEYFNIYLNVRGTSDMPSVRTAVIIGNVESGILTKNIKAKVRIVGKSSANCVVELWIYRPLSYSSVVIRRVLSGSYYLISTAFWTYFVGTGGGSDEPQTDLANNIIAEDFTVLTALTSGDTEIYPTDNSNKLVKSSGLYAMMTNDSGDQMTEAPPQKVYEVGKFYYVSGSVCRCTAYSADSAIFDVYGVVEAMNYVLSQT